MGQGLGQELPSWGGAGTGRSCGSYGGLPSLRTPWEGMWGRVPLRSVQGGRGAGWAAVASWGCARLFPECGSGGVGCAGAALRAGKGSAGRGGHRGAMTKFGVVAAPFLEPLLPTSSGPPAQPRPQSTAAPLLPCADLESTCPPMPSQVAHSGGSCPHLPDEPRLYPAPALPLS